MNTNNLPIPDLNEMGEKAQIAGRAVHQLTAAQKNYGLERVAAALHENSAAILAANALDIEKATAAGMHPGLVDRLRLTGDRIGAMADGLRVIIRLDDPIGEQLDAFTRPNGLKISKRRVPLGVIGIIYESRPNVTADAFGLCFKAGNAVILKGGSDALASN
ncbi:MAG: gamma-glutamyl-phosphate reductase, partial [Lachnospiraceae bacterium]|nr:gamma-glutamyl-phosphate reductase [Lachnospiraceae bacterium]